MEKKNYKILVVDDEIEYQRVFSYILKKNGFRWSPKNNCWQRQLTENARYSLHRVKIEMEGMSK